MSSYQYRNSHYRDKTVLWPSHLYRGNPYRFISCCNITQHTYSIQHHGAPSEASDCSNPPPKMAMTENINSLDPGRPGYHFRTAIFNLVLLTGILTLSKDNALRWMPRDLTDDKSTSVQVMAWCRQATSHYLSQCWPTSMSPYGVTRPQWVKLSVWGQSLSNSLHPERGGNNFKSVISEHMILIKFRSTRAVHRMDWTNTIRIDDTSNKYSRYHWYVSIRIK